MNVLAAELLPQDAKRSILVEEAIQFADILDSYGRRFQEKLREGRTRPSELEVALTLDGSDSTHVLVQHRFSSQGFPQAYRTLLGFQDDLTMYEAVRKTALLAQKWNELGVPSMNVSIILPLHYLAQVTGLNPDLNLPVVLYGDMAKIEAIERNLKQLLSIQESQN